MELMNHIYLQLGSMGSNPWLKAIAGPVTGIAIFVVINLLITRFLIPSLKDKEEINNDKKTRSITEIAKIDAERIGNDNLKETTKVQND